MCGEVRYRACVNPLMANICHRLFCQRRAGSAFAEVVIFSLKNADLSGLPCQVHEHLSDEIGRWLRLEFFPRRGATVGWTAQRWSGLRGVAGGTSETMNRVQCRRHRWTRPAPRWIVFPASVECLESKGLTD